MHLAISNLLSRSETSIGTYEQHWKIVHVFRTRYHFWVSAELTDQVIYNAHLVVSPCCFENWNLTMKVISRTETLELRFLLTHMQDSKIIRLRNFVSNSVLHVKIREIVGTQLVAFVSWYTIVSRPMSHFFGLHLTCRFHTPTNCLINT